LRCSGRSIRSRLIGRGRTPAILADVEVVQVVVAHRERVEPRGERVDDGIHGAMMRACDFACAVVRG